MGESIEAVPQTVQTTANRDRLLNHRAKRNALHLRDGINNLCPEQVDLSIQGLQSEDSQLWVRFGEKANKAGGRRNPNHL